MIHQRTLKSTVRATGVGLHTGHKVAMVLRPAPVDTGIVFCRSDLAGNPAIPAHALNVTNTTMATVIEKEGARVSTVEHLMSAFAGLGIDNAFVDVSARGSADHGRQRGHLRVPDPARGHRGAGRAQALRARAEDGGDRAGRQARAPRALQRLQGRLLDRVRHPVFEAAHSTVEVDFAEVSFVREVSRARTFGFTQEVEMMRAKGLARGGSLDNAIVVDDFRVLNAEGLRMDDEFVKHKALDAVGDLYLLGRPLIGAFYGHKSGHALNNLLLRKLIAQRTAWEEVTFDTAGSRFRAPSRT